MGNEVVPYSMLVPVFGLVSGYVFLGEILNTATMLASIIVMLGIIIPRVSPILFRKRKVFSPT